MTRATRRLRLCGAVGLCAALLVAPLPAARSAGPQVLHVPADLFAPGGPLGSLEIDACRILLADGPGGSLLRVSPAMAGLGFRDIPFTVAPFEREVGIWPLATTLRLRIPGRDTADPWTTIQSTGMTAHVAGASVVLSARFESQGPEMTGEYYALDPRTGQDGWVHALDVEADDLTITVGFPIEARGVALALGTPAVSVDFSFAVSASGLAGAALDDTVAKQMVTAAIERAVADALDLEAYRAPLSAALTAWLLDGPFRGLSPREIRLRPAADGGLDLVVVEGAGR